MAPTWKALPTGEDISLSPGSTYAVVASVSSSTTRAKIDSALAKYFPGVSILSYFEQGESGGPPSDPDTGRKQIAAVVKDASFSGTLSWSKSIFLVAPNIYTLSSAWVLEGDGTLPPSPWAGALAPAPPAPSPVARKAANPWPWVLGVAAVATLGVVGYVHREKIAESLRGLGAKPWMTRA